MRLDHQKSNTMLSHLYEKDKLYPSPISLFCVTKIFKINLSTAATYFLHNSNIL